MTTSWIDIMDREMANLEISSNKYFTDEALEILKKIADGLEIHISSNEVVDNMPPLTIQPLERIFEQKLAMYIVNRIRTGYYEIYPLISYLDIITELNIFVRKMLQKALSNVPSEDSIDNLLDSYPIGLVSKICKTSCFNGHIMGESVRKLIRMRQTHFTWFPKQLEHMTTGNGKLPLTSDELLAVKRYLGSSRNIYVHILLNSVYELGSHDYLLNYSIMDEDELLTIIKSSWFYLFISMNYTS